MRRALVAILLALAGPVAAADVVSPAPAAVEVVIYRGGPVRTADLGIEDDNTSGLALITETRTVDLPAGRSRIRFEGVADGILPQSAAVEGLPAPTIERNFDYNLLSPGSMIAGLIGQPVTVVRTNPKTGQEDHETATLRAGPGGVVLQTARGVEALQCSGAPEKLVFDHVPEGLADRPTLSVLTDVATPGRYQVRLSYLTVRMNWAADYVAHIAPDGAHLALTGWITLANHTALSFKDAPTSVIAGRLSRVPVDLPDIAAKPAFANCWPSETTHSGWPEPPPPPPAPPMAPTPMMARAGEAFGEVIVTARKRTSQRNLGDYKLYALNEPTTVAARQTKQVQFLDQPHVAFETVYVGLINAWPGNAPDPGEQQPTTITLRLDNKKTNGLGEDLPAGRVSLRLPGANGELYAGEHSLWDVPIGEPFDIRAGEAANVFLQQRVVSDTTTGSGDHKREVATFEITAFNRKTGPAMVEIRHTSGGMQGFKVDKESLHHGLKGGDPVWRLPLAAGAERTVTYTFSFDQ